MKTNRRDVLVQLFKFGVVGAFNTLVDVGLFRLFMAAYEYWGSGWPFGESAARAAAQTVSFVVAVFFSFVINGRWTFQSNQAKSRTALVRQYLLSAGVFGVMQLLLWVFPNIWGLDACTPALWLDVKTRHLIDPSTFVKILATAPCVILNFLGSKLWVFRERKPI